MSKIEQTTKPPSNALRAEAWRDLAQDKDLQTYLVTPTEGKPFTVKLRKNNRRILDTLIERPIFAASPVRISDNVHILKRDYGINIETKMFENDTETDRAKFGVYFLVDHIKPIQSDEVAA